MPSTTEPFFSLRQKSAFITGGISGIGLAVAERYRAAGARVVMADVRDGRSIAARIGAQFIQADVSDEQQVAQALADAEATVGRLDILVNNAGVGDLGGGLDGTETAMWDKVLAVNVYGVFYGLKHGPKHMNDGGAIINTASQAAFTKSAGMEPYAASKSAVVSLTQTAAIELAERLIRVNAVCPTSIHTPMTKENDAEFEAVRLCTQLGRAGETSDLVGLYHFLGADESRFITGQSILVDGGWTAGVSKKLLEAIIRTESKGAPRT